MLPLLRVGYSKILAIMVDLVDWQPAQTGKFHLVGCQDGLFWQQAGPVWLTAEDIECVGVNDNRKIRGGFRQVGKQGEQKILGAVCLTQAWTDQYGVHVLFRGKGRPFRYKGVWLSLKGDSTIFFRYYEPNRFRDAGGKREIDGFGNSGIDQPGSAAQGSLDRQVCGTGEVR